ncbi:hypothetical protein, partial [Ferrovibrio sp.]|uniref:hypothetical protein n=1 Tax=Ferrovibrio sp. TaxID=1917215 RepID=UPI00262F4CC0
MTQMPADRSGFFRRLAGLALLLISLSLPQAQAQTQGQADEAAEMPGETEDVAAGATIVRGRYTLGDTSAEWEAAIKDGKPERI